MGDPIAEYKIESWTLFAFGVIIVFLRLFARWKVVGFREFKLDDYLMVLAITFDASLNALAHFMMKVGVTNSKLDMASRELLTPSEQRQRAIGSQIWMSGWCTYSAVVAAWRSGRLNFAWKTLHRQVLITWAFWITGISGVCVYAVFFLTCRPAYKLWQSYPYPGKECEAETPVFYLTTLVFNVLTDLFIISIPMPVLWSARIPPKRKAMMILLFGGGFFVIIAAILRCVLGLTSPVPTTTAQWACRETFVAIVIGNAPMIKPLFSRQSWAIASTGKDSQTAGSAMELSRRSKKNKSVTDTNFESESMEKIVEQRGGVLEIVADTTYSISSAPAETTARDAEHGEVPQNHTGESSPTYRPNGASYSIVIQGASGSQRDSHKNGYKNVP